MKISVNEKPVKSELSEQDTLHDLIDELREAGEIRPDEIVAALAIDSRPLRSGEMETVGATNLESISQVEIETDDVTGYGRRILCDASSMAGVLTEAGSRISALLRDEKIEEANDRFYSLLQALQNLLACLDTVQTTCLPQIARTDARRVTMALLSAALDTVVRCQENENWATMADRLDEHLIPAMNGLRNLLDSLHRQVQCKS
jgi:sulfur carrier protein ThiS